MMTELVRVAYCADVGHNDIEDVLNLILKPAQKNSTASTLYNFTRDRVLMFQSPFSTKFERRIVQNCPDLLKDVSLFARKFKEERKVTILRIGRKTVLMNQREEAAMAESKIRRSILSRKTVVRRIDCGSLVKLLQNVKPISGIVCKDNSVKNNGKVTHMTPRVVRRGEYEDFIIPNDRDKYKNPSYPKLSEDKYPVQATDMDTDCPSMQMAINAPPAFPSYLSESSSSTAVASSHNSNRPNRDTRDGGSLFTTAPRYPDYTGHTERLLTFETTTWQLNEKPDKTVFADQGFFFTGREDLVRCYTCGIGLKDWVKNDDVLKEHAKHSPKCSFLLTNFGKNVVDRIQTETSVDAVKPGSQLPYKVRSPQYQTMEARLYTFRTFPSIIGIPHQQLAVAGLYFTGKGDLCRCFTCDGGLKDWSTGDDPCKEHATYFPLCSYINQLKGKEYVSALQQRLQMGATGAGAPQTMQDTNASMLVSSMDRLNISSNDQSRLIVSQVMAMGYSEREVIAAKEELEKNGEKYPSAESIVHVLLDMHDRKAQTTITEKVNDEDDLAAIAAENERLTQMVQCMLCVNEEPDILFLPCAHHRICHNCSENITRCPVCNDYIRDKVRTYRA